MTYTIRQGKLLSGIVFLCGFAFLVAVNHCSLEAFAEQASSHEALHHRETAPDYPENSPVHNHDEGSVCCSTLKAIPASKSFEIRPSLTTSFLSPFEHRASWSDTLLESSDVTTGLSPSAQESPPATPFYRTTYANHAPPVCLA